MACYGLLTVADVMRGARATRGPVIAGLPIDSTPVPRLPL
jgi:hypothetical protein